MLQIEVRGLGKLRGCAVSAAGRQAAIALVATLEHLPLRIEHIHHYAEFEDYFTTSDLTFGALAPQWAAAFEPLLQACKESARIRWLGALQTAATSLTEARRGR